MKSTFVKNFVKEKQTKVRFENIKFFFSSKRQLFLKINLDSSVSKKTKNLVINNLKNPSLLMVPVSSWTKDILDFYHIWPWHQWLTSLITLIFLYWITGYFYNKWLSDRGGWLDFKMRVWLIISDLTMNLALGLYYMHYRETLMGAIMLKCPIAISPVIFILEMICVYIYYRFWKKDYHLTKKN